MHWRTAKGPTGTSTVSMTPAMHAFPVSLTPAKTCIAGVIDTGEVGDVYFTPAMHALPVSLTPANACFAGVGIFVGEEFFAGVIDTGEAL
jgi:hypothetical protein